MTRSRTVIVVGAGIGGLTLALALARKGLRAVVLEQAERLEETGAGIQLSPNATRVLLALGLGERLRPRVVAPQAIRILRARNAAEIARVPLGVAAEARFGAPYWVIHRADLQAALGEAVAQTPDAVLRLGVKVEDFAVHAHGVTVQARSRAGAIDEHGFAAVGADGLWSTMRARLGDRQPPRFGRRTAWRAVVPADRVAPEFAEPSTVLWLGPNAHVVHYPVKAGQALNIVAIVREDWQKAGWSAPGKASDLLARFAGWAPQARALLAAPQGWLKWSLYDRSPVRRWSQGPLTLLGDAAHPMLPFLAQGGAMAIEDAAALADCLAAGQDYPERALRAYERRRCRRTARVQREARRNGIVYHLRGPAAWARDLALKVMGGRLLLWRYNWLYDWRS